jgi:hypothetical protein
MGRATKVQVWTEFAGGMTGWDVCLNNYGFDHIGLLQDYARTYHKAAKRLFEELRQTLCDEDRFVDHRDMDAHPIAFLYRHALEVYLKTVVDFGNSLLWLRGKPVKGRAEILKDHGLAALLPSVQEIFGLTDCSTVWNAPLCQSFADVERIVKAVDCVTHDALRYPVRMQKGKIVELLPGGLGFNALIFADKMDALLNVLDAAAGQTADTFQVEALAALNRNEWRASYRRSPMSTGAEEGAP